MFASMHMNRCMHVYVKDLAKHKQKQKNYQHLWVKSSAMEYQKDFLLIPI